LTHTLKKKEPAPQLMNDILKGYNIILREAWNTSQQAITDDLFTSDSIVLTHFTNNIKDTYSR
jgi:adenine-specific DNA methylase